MNFDWSNDDQNIVYTKPISNSLDGLYVVDMQGNNKKIQEGIGGYVASLLAIGGPAVNVFKILLGPEKQQEYVRTMMFVLDK